MPERQPAFPEHCDNVLSDPFPETGSSDAPLPGMTKCRRLVRDGERLVTHSAVFIHRAFSGLMLRFLFR